MVGADDPVCPELAGVSVDSWNADFRGGTESSPLPFDGQRITKRQSPNERLKRPTLGFTAGGWAIAAGDCSLTSSTAGRIMELYKYVEII
ncbi:MAG: hypothetical protein ACOX6S_06495 [Clostridia bacterium]